MENDIGKIPRLQGWDDEKIYFYDRKNIEYCIYDDEEVYRILLEMCIILFQTSTKSEIATFIKGIQTFIKLKKTADDNVTDYHDEAMIEPIPTVSSYGMNGRIPIERLEFCCKYLKAAALGVDGEDVVLAFKGFKTDENGDTWFAKCPFCGAKFVLDDRGMIVKRMGEC
jgi:hypothetical protein